MIQRRQAFERRQLLSEPNAWCDQDPVQSHPEVLLTAMVFPTRLIVV